MVGVMRWVWCGGAVWCVAMMGLCVWAEPPSPPTDSSKHRPHPQGSVVSSATQSAKQGASKSTKGTDQDRSKAKDRLEQDLKGMLGIWHCPMVLLGRAVKIVIKQGGAEIHVNQGAKVEWYWSEGQSTGAGEGEYLAIQSKTAQGANATEYSYLIFAYRRALDGSVRFTVYPTSAQKARDGSWKHRIGRRLESNIPQRCLSSSAYAALQSKAKQPQEADIAYCRGIVGGQRLAFRKWVFGSGCAQEMCLVVAWQNLFERMAACLEGRGYDPYPFLYTKPHQQRVFQGLFSLNAPSKD